MKARRPHPAARPCQCSTRDCVPALSGPWIVALSCLLTHIPALCLWLYLGPAPAPQVQWYHILVHSLAHSRPQPAPCGDFLPFPTLMTCPPPYLAAQWEALPCSCCDLRCHVHLRRHCGQQHPQWGDVQVPGGAHGPAEQAATPWADSTVGPAKVDGPC